MATYLRAERGLVAATMCNMRDSGEVVVARTQPNPVSQRTESVYRLATAEERRAAVSSRRPRRSSPKSSALDRKLKMTRLKRARAGSGVIAPAPYYRGALWPIVPKRKAAA